ncbi:MAG: 1,4-dihydroxy-2-naphthoate octaprenyltransferase [Candidatus Omnitrophota bacterium]
MRKSSERIMIWLKAARPFSFTASVTPVLLGAAAAFALGIPARWELLPWFLLCTFLIHAATNMINDVYDYRKGADREDTYGSSGVITGGVLTPEQVHRGAFAALAAAFIIGMGLVLVRGVPILVLGCIGALGGYAYSGAPLGYKYYALGDLAVFLLMGVCLVAGSYYALTADLSWRVILFSLPISCLVSAILHANNLRDIPHDRRAGFRTLAGILGHQKAGWFYTGLIVLPYVLTAGYILSGLLGSWSWLILLTAPLAGNNIVQVFRSSEGVPSDLARLDQQTAKLHLTFGLIFILSLVLQKGSL